MALLPQVRPGERRDALVGFSTLAGMMTAHALLETARDALFLAKMPPSRLPWAYLAIAAFAFVAARANARLLERFDRRMLLTGTLLAAAAGTAGFYGLLHHGTAASFYAFYVWTGLLATVAVVQLWSLLGEVFTVSQAKRLFGLIGAGGLVGATAGSALARALLTGNTRPRLLLLVASGLFVATAAGLVAGRGASCQRGEAKRAQAPGPQPGEAQAPEAAGYLRRLSLLVLVSTVAVTIVDYTFKSAVAESVPRERLGAYFADAYLAFNVLSLSVQLFAASWLLRVLGVGRALALLPLLLAAGSALAPASAGVASALALKGADAALRNSLQRTGMEVLYFPLPPQVRSRFKGLIDGVGQRGAQALASLAILGAAAAGASGGQLLLIVAGLSLVWAVAALGVERDYLALFRHMLGRGDEPTEAPELDLHALEALVSALNSEHDEEVLAALDLLEQLGKSNLVPALLLYHPSKAVVMRGLDLLAASGRHDFVSVAKRLLSNDDEQVRAAALRALLRASPSPALIAQVETDASAEVRATAAVGVVAAHLPGEDEAAEWLDRWAKSGPHPLRLALLRAIGLQRDPRLLGLLRTMADAGDPALWPELARALEASPSPDLAPALVAMLADRDAREPARRALLAQGEAGLRALAGALADPETPLALRRQLPRAIRRFGSPEAAARLLERLGVETDASLFHSLLKSVGRLHAELPDLALDRRLIAALLRRALGRASDLLSARAALPSGEPVPSWPMLERVVDQTIADETEHVFRLLALLTEGEDLRSLHAAATSRDPKLRASSRELLEHLVPRELRAAVLSLVDDLPPEGRHRALAGALGASIRNPSLPRALEALAEDRCDALRFTAEHALREMRQAGLLESAPRPAPLPDRAPSPLGPTPSLRPA